MLTYEQCSSLRQHLTTIAEIVPYRWGRMQTKTYDRKLPRLFEYENYDELNRAIAHYVSRGYLSTNDEENNYYRHRWFVYKCSQVDEFLFCSLPEIVGTEQNPWFDFTMFNRFKLDLKGTVMLKQYKSDPEYVFKNPLALIDSFYKEQSRDSYYRRRLQNRLFLVHHSFISPSREPVLRTMFNLKEKVFAQYAKLLSQPSHKLFDYMNGRIADVIFLVEREDGTMEYGFGSENLKLPVQFRTL